MFWADEILEHIQGEQTINDSKTPSGRVHVGALRGVLIHDAVFQVLKEKKVPVRYLYGVDDYDPVDEIPAGMGEIYREHLGKPLFSAPPPPGSSAGDMAEHYISEFFDVFKDLEVHPEIYRMRDVYRSGRFNSAIDRILSHAADVRRIYFEVSNSVRPESWFPFQTICEQCGRIGTTEVFAYDGKEVSYRCRRDLVKWAEGCGYEGKVSPFDGKGKLPWKLEWVAKWAEFPVTIEGAGKDHSTRGGSRDVSEKILREVFGLNPPLNIPYEFFLVGGAKMSSSKGLGASAREMCDFLPQDLLRFLMIRPKPQRPVNFEPDEKNITKLFNEYDRFHSKVHAGEGNEEEQRIIGLSDPWGFSGYNENFQVLTTLVQLSHLDLWAEIEKRKGSPLTDAEREHLLRRIHAAQFWLENYALDEERVVLQREVPERAAELSQAQRAFVQSLAEKLEETAWDEESIQSALYEVTRLLPLAQPKAFLALYRLFLDRDSGPKAGNLLGFLEKDFVLARLRALDCDWAEAYQELSLDLTGFGSWLEKQKKKPEWQGYSIPDAMPGLVYLHFSVEDKPQRLLLCGDSATSVVDQVQAKLGISLQSV